MERAERAPVALDGDAYADLKTAYLTLRLELAGADYADVPTAVDGLARVLARSAAPPAAGAVLDGAALAEVAAAYRSASGYLADRDRAGLAGAADRLERLLDAIGPPPPYLPPAP